MSEASVKLTKLAGGVAFNVNNGRRPHFLSGTHESLMNRPPVILPLLQRSQEDIYDPQSGSLSVVGDAVVIKRLVDVLKSRVAPIDIGYSGETLNGKRHGKGVHRYESGAIFDGMWRHGSKHGRGTFFYANGDVCSGTWVNDKIQGNVVYRYYDGDTYEGEFANDKMHDTGFYTFAYGDVYIGNYSEGERVGVGIYRYTNGDEYRGAYKDFQRVGKSVYTYANGDTYEVSWRICYSAKINLNILFFWNIYTA